MFLVVVEKRRRTEVCVDALEMRRVVNILIGSKMTGGF
jgi:hypothetical protein